VLKKIHIFWDVTQSRLVESPTCRSSVMHSPSDTSALSSKWRHHDPSKHR